MIDHDILLDPEKLMDASSPNLNNFRPSLNVPNLGIFSELSEGFFVTSEEVIPVAIVVDHDVLFNKRSDVDIIFDKLHVFPRDFEVGFITEDINDQIVLMSTFREIKTVTGVSILNQGGLILQFDEVPFPLCPNYAELNDLTILKDGLPFQNSLITYTFEDGSTYEVKIEGQRIEPFIFELNFESLDISFGFDTVISRDDKTGAEQRRSVSLRNKSMRDTEIEVLEFNLEAQRLLNHLKKIGNKVLGVPVFSEPIKILSDPEGLEEFTFVRELENKYYNLQNLSEFIMIKDFKDPSKLEIKPILSLDFASKKILVESIFENNYSPKTTIAYPVIISTMEEPSVSTVNSETKRINLTFREFR